MHKCTLERSQSKSVHWAWHKLFHIDMSVHLVRTVQYDTLSVSTLLQIDYSVHLAQYKKKCALSPACSTAHMHECALGPNETVVHTETGYTIPSRLQCTVGRRTLLQVVVPGPAALTGARAYGCRRRLGPEALAGARASNPCKRSSPSLFLAETPVARLSEAW